MLTGLGATRASNRRGARVRAGKPCHAVTADSTTGRARQFRRQRCPVLERRAGSTYHYRGIGWLEAAAAEQAADAAFGGILDCLDRTGEAHRAAGLALSDNGHITGRQKLDTTAPFGEGGDCEAGGAPGIGGIILAPGSGAFVFRATPDADADATIADWIADQA